MNRFLLTVVVFLTYFCTAFAQNTDNKTKDLPIAQTLKQQLLLYLNNNNEEKIYVQTDKTFYKPGEKIYYNLFLTDASTGKPSSISDKTYIELYDPKGNSIAKQIIYVQDGTGGGSFTVSQHFPGGLYTLKAYTSWMKNFGVDRFFTKTLTVQQTITPRLLLKLDFEKKAYGPEDEVSATLTVRNLKDEKADGANIRTLIHIDGVLYSTFDALTDSAGKAVLRFQLPNTLSSPDGLLQAIVSYQGVEESVSRSIPITLNRIDLKFYPEGGTWVAGAIARMAFEALNEFGKGADVSGEIIDEDGNHITTFESFHFGMGAFEMTPKAGKRSFARITKPLGTDSLFALPVAENTLSLNLKEQHKTDILWNIFAPQKTTACLIVQVNGLIYDSKTVSLEQGENQVHFNIEKLPAGIAVFTLFDDEARPACERLVFVNAEKKLHFSIQTDKTTYLPGDKVKATIEVKDEIGNPVAARFSMAVIDDQLLSLADDKQDNILTYLWLSSELSGKIHEPSFYFNKEEEKSEKAVDYLLLTHGWRRFNWHDIYNSPDTHPYFPENSTRIDGILLNKQGKPIRGDVTLVENGGQGRVLNVKTNKNGAFTFLNVDRTTEITLYTFHLKKIVVNDTLSKYSVTTSDIEKRLSFNSTDYKNEAYSYINPLSREVKKNGQNISGVLATKEGVASTDGEITSIRGSRSDGQQMIIDGVRVRGSSNELQEVVVMYVPPVFNQDHTTSAIKLSGDEVRKTPGRSITAVLSDSYPYDSYRYFKRDMWGRFTYFHNYNPIWDNGSIYTGSYLVLPRQDTRSKTSSYQLAPRSKYISNEERTNFNTTVFWKSTMITNKEGKAEINFITNDATTAFRMTAEGLSSCGLIGRGEHVYSTQLPLSVDVKLPHYLSLGDTLQIPVMVRNNTTDTLLAHISVEAQNFRFIDKFGERKYIPPQISEKLFYTVTNNYKSGKHPIVVTLKNDSFEDVISHDVEVLSPAFPRTFSIAGKETERTVEFDLSDWDMREIEGSFDLLINSYEELLSNVTSLLRQPSGCFEQVASSNYPNIFVMQLLQTTGKKDVEIEKKAVEFLRSGYQKLAAYESKGGGFEWYGGSPAHEVLSAYGLVQFYEMNKIGGLAPVNKEMIERTLQFLRSRRNDDGTYNQNAGRYGFSGAPQSVGNAYIAYALAEIEKPDMLAYQQALAEAFQSKDMYRMALMANAAIKQNQTEDYDKLITYFKEQLRVFPKKKLKIESSIVRSSTAQTEAIALWAIALMRAETLDIPAIERCMQYLASQKGSYGYGSTQATALALKAFSDYTLKVPPIQDFPSDVTLKINEQEYVIPYSANFNKTISHTEFMKHLQQGKNKISIQFSDSTNLIPYALVFNGSSITPSSSANCPLQLSLNLTNTTVKQNESVRLSIQLKNKRSEGQPMSMAVIGIPAGLAPQAWQLKELQEKGVFDFYEILKNQLVFYYREMGPNEIKNIHLDLKAEISGNYIGTASSAYLYYTQEERHWLKGLEIIINKNEIFKK